MYPKILVFHFGILLAYICEYGFVVAQTSVPMTTTTVMTTTVPWTPTTTPRSVTFTTSRAGFSFTTTTNPGTRVFTSTSSPNSGTRVFTTTTSIPRTTTTLPPKTTTPRVPTVPIVCKRNKTGEFQLLTAAADPSVSKYGSFAGYFKFRSACQKLCKQNYKDRCFAYMHDPQKNGTCTIFQRNTINGKLDEKQNSKASIFLKCGKPAPSVSKSCCDPLESLYISSANGHYRYPEGNVLFTYDNNTCRTTASVKCQRTHDQTFAEIVVNMYDSIQNRLDTSTISATCQNRTWRLVELPLTIQTLQCYVQYDDYYSYSDDYSYYNY